MDAENRFENCRRWLELTSLMFLGVGITLALFGDSIVFAPWNDRIAATFYAADSLPTEAQNLKNFLVGPLGGTIAGNYVLQYFIAKYPMKKREAWSFRASVISLLLWYVVDGAVSIYHGALFNVLMINTVTLVVHGVPLFLIRNDFDSAPD